MLQKLVAIVKKKQRSVTLNFLSDKLKFTVHCERKYDNCLLSLEDSNVPSKEQHY